MAKKLTRKQWRLRKAIAKCIRVSVLTILTFVVFILIVRFANEWISNKKGNMNQYEDDEFVLDGVKLSNGVKVQADLLTPNANSRPQTKIKNMNGIVIHYVGNPNTTAKNNRDYFQGLAKSHETSASSHFVIGLKGEIVQCIPINEVAYCSNNRNDDTISIEVCHPDKDGKFNTETYESVVSLTAYLCNMFELSTDDVIRHYDVTGKKCPLYYVDHEDAWIQLKADVDSVLHKISQPEQKKNKE